MRGYDLQLLSKSSIRRHEWTRQLCSGCKQWRGDQSSTQGTYKSTGSAPGGFGTREKFIQNEKFVYGFRFGCIGQAVCDFQLIFTTKRPQLHTSWTWAHGNLAFLKVFILVSVLCKENASGLLRNIPVNLVLGYILLSLSDLHGSLMLASWGKGGAATHLISLHLLLDFRDVPVRPDVHRLSLPLHRQHTGERTEVKPDE